MNHGLFSGFGIFIPVKNLSEATKWYSDVLGFAIIRNGEPFANVMKMGDGTVVFCLLKVDEIEPSPFPKNDYGVDHYYNFRTTEIRKLHQHYLEKGANVSEIDDFDGISGFEFSDPCGNRFCVVE
ncbi:Glyoxalase/Bleomycin resistance protein/Dioxygenase superfamily protein [Evansella caseinilytica]|uniref:Glyoxalase/Bleomycin resistance protein/Dioxygenase superfamily protein n=1 Tax=Evansella caseinilytica TaxID=1503961 RepID=A0A1H3ULS5_9BACI|nr:VOC family protein [Evansella caseinilytica]SDZ63380.1 Glyoxalase/Bleomycin resistance protein/Dioxygenase superfamily protein [Evansella caseinilytica]